MQSLFTLLVPTSNMLENRRTDNVTISNDLHFLSLKKTKKIPCMLPWVCTLIDHRKRQNVVEHDRRGHDLRHYSRGMLLYGYLKFNFLLLPRA